jgi:hypothetical protein
MMRQDRDHRERFLRDYVDDDGLRQALADGSPAAIAATIARIRDDEAFALDQLREVLRR